MPRRTRRTSASPITRKRSWISARRSARARGPRAPCARSRAIARRPQPARKRCIPAPRPKRERAQRQVAVLVVRDPDGRVLLERRPARGIWGGLYSLPELPAEDSPREWCARMLGAAVAVERVLATIEHAFTHFDLDLTPRLLELAANAGGRQRPRRLALVPARHRARRRRAGARRRASQRRPSACIVRVWQEKSPVSCSAPTPKASTGRRIPARSANASTRTCRSSRGSAGSSIRRCCSTSIA